MCEWPWLRALQEFGHLRALAQLHVRLLPVRSLARVAALTLDLAVRDRGADAVDLRSEQLLDGALDLDLVRARGHFEHDRPAVFAHDRRFLRDERPSDDVCQLHKSLNAGMQECKIRNALPSCICA